MKSQAYFFAVLAAATGITGAAAIGPATRVQAAAPAANVKIANFTFQQPSLTVKPGATVTWTNDDDIPHTVTANDKSFKSKVLDSGQSFSFTFAKAGEFGYFCSLHPHMTGKIVVRA